MDVCQACGGLVCLHRQLPNRAPPTKLDPVILKTPNGSNSLGTTTYKDIPPLERAGGQNKIHRFAVKELPRNLP